MYEIGYKVKLPIPQINIISYFLPENAGETTWRSQYRINFKNQLSLGIVKNMKLKMLLNLKIIKRNPTSGSLTIAFFPTI